MIYDYVQLTNIKLGPVMRRVTELFLILSGLGISISYMSSIAELFT